MRSPYPKPTGNARADLLTYPVKKTILFVLFIALAILAFAGSGQLVFKDSKLESGTAGANNAVYRFPQVTSDLDALVKITDRSSALVKLLDIDMKTSGFDKAWQPQVTYNNNTAPGPAEWWMDFEISFVKKGTNTAADIQEFNLSAIDIDGNGDKIREYVSFRGLKSYVLESNSILVVSDLLSLINGLLTNVGKKFEGPTRNYLNIDTSGTSVMVTAKYQNTQKFTVRTGAVATGANGAADRMYSLYFQDFKYSQPSQVTLPVDLTSFTAKYNSPKVQLTWESSIETNFSHYIVERSTDGKEYKQVTMIFSEEEQPKPVYNYSENVSASAQGLVYFRLKMVDKDGKFTYSPVKIVRLSGSDNSVAVSVYPNPVTSELRITVPEGWQDQKIVYDLFNTSGALVKKVVSNKASQTESLPMSDIQAGSYVIRLTNGTETASQKILKSR